MTAVTYTDPMVEVQALLRTVDGSTLELGFMAGDGQPSYRRPLLDQRGAARLSSHNHGDHVMTDDMIGTVNVTKGDDVTLAATLNTAHANGYSIDLNDVTIDPPAGWLDREMGL